MAYHKRHHHRKIKRVYKKIRRPHKHKDRSKRSNDMVNEFTKKVSSEIPEYTLNNIDIIESSRFGKLEFNQPDFKEKSNLVESDWFPSEPYSVFVDEMILCSNIKITQHHIHFHFACGYNPEFEFPGAEESFSKLRKYLIVRKERVNFFEKDGKKYYVVKTIPKDWDKLYVYGENEGMHFCSDYKKPWEVYQWYVDWLLKINDRKLKEIGKENYLVDRTAGERIVADCLKRLNIRYIPEYKIENLIGDKLNYRIADFYLPKEDIYIEINGGLNTPNVERRGQEVIRYNEKKEVYEKNNLRFIYIFPVDLSHVEYILALAISDYISHGKLSDKLNKLQNVDVNTQISKITSENKFLEEKMSKLYERLTEMEEKSITFKINKPFKELKKSISETLLKTRKEKVSQSKQTNENKLNSLLDERETLQNELNQIQDKIETLSSTPIGNIKKVFNEVFKK